MDYIDLHLHSCKSDGTDTPQEIVQKAVDLGLKAIAITDHDTVSGVLADQQAGERLGMEVVAGIEVSSDYKDNNVHILGYFIDPFATALRPVLVWVKNEREKRNCKIVAMMQRDGFEISVEELKEKYPNSVIGRPHMAELLMNKGYVSSVKEGFEKYLEVGRPYYLPKKRISVREAVSAIEEAGGVAVLAHPLQYHYPENEVYELVETAKSAGVRAIEAYYSEHSEEDEKFVLSLAEKYSLAVSGGSDYHGPRKTHISMGSGTGRLRVPAAALDGLKELRD